MALVSVLCCLAKAPPNTEIRKKKYFAAVLTAVIFAATLTVPVTTTEAPSIRASSYKGSALSTGEHSSLIIGPNGTEYTITSSDLDTVAVERVPTFWVAVFLWEICQPQAD